MRRESVNFLMVFGAGVAIGFFGCRALLEKKMRDELDECYESLKRVHTMVEEKQQKHDEDQGVLFTVDIHRPTGEIEKDVPLDEAFAKNDYYKAIQESAEPQSISYIDEEDYLDDDGRFKGKIDLLMDDGSPVFLEDGQPIDDWDEKVGESILVDFYTHVPEGLDPVLYVRNHRTDSDYEVVRVIP